MPDEEPQAPKRTPLRPQRCWFAKHDWCTYTVEALAPNEEGAFRPAELVIMTCKRCGKVA